MRNLLLSVLALSLVVALGAQSAEQEVAQGEAVAPHPKAPPETSQLAFLIGEWELETWFAKPDGSRRTGSASMLVRYSLDGFAVELTDRHPSLRGGPDFLSTTTYVYNKSARSWIGSGINTLGNRKDYVAEFDNGELVSTQSGMLFGGRSGINRMTYFDIEEASFELVHEHSADDGETWQEPAFGYSARRVD